MKKIGSSQEINKVLKGSDFYVKKRFGQNFLKDQNILNKIADAGAITKDSLVVEIGPGFGGLTELLLDRAKHVIAYEIDTELIPILSNTFKDTNNLTLINKDILKVDVDFDIKELGITCDKVVVVANLPYYITTPILMKFIEESTLTSKMIVMMQLEVAKRITSAPSTKDYNSLSIAIQYKTDAVIAFNVPRTVFIPQPNVDSAVVVLDIKDKPDHEPIDEDVFYKLIRASFTQRRKTLLNNLRHNYDLNREQIEVMLEELEIKLNERAENLSILDFIRIADYFTNNF
ncbi:MAG: 16S rRNA (adenine(1518)-N(6)/adenine(1519)-N(6))-dimethyltransferase RsmA [Candidatus Izemoplasma sp.]